MGVRILAALTTLMTMACAALAILALGSRFSEDAAAGPKPRLIEPAREGRGGKAAVAPSRAEPASMPKTPEAVNPPALALALPSTPATPAALPVRPAGGLEGNALPDVAGRLGGLLGRELALSEFQRARVLAVLQRREANIAGYHRQILAAGVFSESDYDRRTGRLRLDSYDEIASVLDSAQGQAFSAMVAEARLGDGSAFEIPEGLVIIR